MDHLMSGIEDISGVMMGNYKLRDKYVEAATIIHLASTLTTFFHIFPIHSWNNSSLFAFFI